MSNNLPPALEERAKAVGAAAGEMTIAGLMTIVSSPAFRHVLEKTLRSLEYGGPVDLKFLISAGRKYARAAHLVAEDAYAKAAAYGLRKLAREMLVRQPLNLWGETIEEMAWCDDAINEGDLTAHRRLEWEALTRGRVV